MQQKYILRSEGTIIHDRGAWVLDASYAIGNLATNDGSTWYCWAPHIAAAGNEPGVGANYEDCWRPWGFKGDQGTQGIQGPTGIPLGDVNWLGDWDDEVTYAAGAGVTWGGSAYVSVQGTNLNHEPPNATWWAAVLGDEQSENPLPWNFAIGKTIDGSEVRIIDQYRRKVGSGYAAGSQDGLALHTALAAAHALGGGKVKLVCDLLTNDQVVTSFGDVLLEGMGKNRTVITSSANPIINIDGSSELDVIYNSDQLADLALVPSGVNTGLLWWHGLTTATNKAFYTGFRDVLFNCAGASIGASFYGIQLINMRNCDFRGAYTNYGIRCDGNGYKGVQGLLLNGCSFVSCLEGVKVVSSDNILTAGFYFDHCWWANVEDYGVNAVGVNDINISNSSIDSGNVGGSAIKFDYCLVGSIVNTHIGYYNNGIELICESGLTSRIRVHDNEFYPYGTTGAGITIPRATANVRATFVRIVGNELDSLPLAINFSGTEDGYSDHGQIKDNNFVASTIGIYGQGMANYQVNDNDFTACGTPFDKKFITITTGKGNTNLADF